MTQDNYTTPQLKDLSEGNLSIRDILETNPYNTSGEFKTMAIDHQKTGDEQEDAL
jgi:hypothetical protein